MTKFEHVWTIAIANIVRPDQLYGGDVVTLQQLAQSLSYLSAKQALHIRHPSKVLQNLLRKEALSWKKRMTQVQSTPVFLEGICGSHSPRILSASRPFVRSDLTQILADSARNPQHITYFDILWLGNSRFFREIRDLSRPLTGPRPGSFKWATNLILKTARIALSGAQIQWLRRLMQI